MIQFDSYFSDGLTPPTNCAFRRCCFFLWTALGAILMGRCNSLHTHHVSTICTHMYRHMCIDIDIDIYIYYMYIYLYMCMCLLCKYCVSLRDIMLAAEHDIVIATILTSLYWMMFLFTHAKLNTSRNHVLQVIFTHIEKRIKVIAK